MAVSSFRHVSISGMKTVIPQHCIRIDDELQFFDGNPKKLARAKKMMGYGCRYIADDLTTVTDLAIDAAEKLIAEMKLDREKIDLLLFVNQKPDHPEPCDACIAHGKLAMPKTCATLDLNLGCSGYVHALWTASAMISSGAVKNCLLLAGDMCGRKTDQSNRKAAPVFGDAASATFLEYTEEQKTAFFVMGTDGAGWDRIVYPFGGMRLPLDKASLEVDATDATGNLWTATRSIMKGEDVFKFTMDVAPALIRDTLNAAQWSPDDVDLYAIHQANRQIVENIIDQSGIPAAKAPVDVFTKYANNSTNSVVTVLCDQPVDAKLDRVILCAFGIGLSWGGAALNLSGMYNGGISTYAPPENRLTRQQQIEYWIKFFKGEER